MMNETNPSVLAVGESMIELSDTGEHSASWTYAGDALNWAVAISQALPGADVHHLCAVGDDERSGRFAAFCADLGVSVSLSPVLDGRNMGIYWISTVNGDRRFRYWRAESAAREHLRSASRVLPLEAPDVVMFSSITLAVAGGNASTLLDEIAEFHERGTIVVYDTNFRSALWSTTEATRSVEARAFDVADYVHASLDDVVAVWGASLPDFVAKLSEAGVVEAVITDGPGEVIIASAGSTTSIQPMVADPIDTSGAGDAFFGTYVGRRLCGSSVVDAVDGAAEVCARVVTHAGALTYRLPGTERSAGDSGSPETPG